MRFSRLTWDDIDGVKVTNGSSNEESNEEFFQMSWLNFTNTKQYVCLSSQRWNYYTVGQSLLTFRHTFICKRFFIALAKVRNLAWQKIRNFWGWNRYVLENRSSTFCNLHKYCCQTHKFFKTQVEKNSKLKEWTNSYGVATSEFFGLDYVLV